MSKLSRSLAFSTDSYKVSHWLQFPPGIEEAYYYISSRGGADWTLFFGLQAVIKKVLSEMPTVEEVELAEKFWKAHGLPFNKQGWLDLIDLGYFPLEIQAVPEGTKVGRDEVMVTIRNTNKRFFWLPSWLETRLLQVWYPISVATKTWECKKVILDCLEKTGTPADVGFKLHSFGYRGVSSQESAEMGGMAELVNFMGTDTVAGILSVHEYYNTDEMVGFSIPAAEHSTITAWGRENEKDAYANMLTQFARQGSLLAVVSDSYDIDNAVSNIWGKELKQQVIDSGATVVIRPDSGDPAVVVLRVVRKLAEAFGTTTNSKGYKVLNNVRVIQGDGIDGPENINEILSAVVGSGYSADNLAFGMGGGSLQHVDRDTYKFAMKCSAVKVNGVWKDVFKCPVDALWKASKAGRVTNENLRSVYLDGNLIIDEDFQTIRDRAASQ